MENELKQSSPLQCAFAQMSKSLKERLKKCGRYHSNAAKDEKVATSILDSSSTQNCLHSPLSRTGTKFSNLEESNNSRKGDSYETPKRRSLRPVNEDSLKKRKIDYECHAHSTVSKYTNEDSAEKKLNIQSVLELERLESKHSVVQIDTEAAKVFPSTSTCLPVSKQITQNVFLEMPIDGHTPNLTKDGHNCTSKIPPEDLTQAKRNLEQELKKTEEQLRKLKMIKMYREKNNFTELQGLINTWREVSQKALVDLLELHPPPKPTMAQLITHLQIDPMLVRYDAEDESFT